MFNNTGLGSFGGSAGMTSPQQQFQQFQQSMATPPASASAMNPMMNQYTYPMGMAPNPYQQMQMVPGPPPAMAVAAGAPALGRSPQQNFMFAAQPPLQSSPPNFLN